MFFAKSKVSPSTGIPNNISWQISENYNNINKSEWRFLTDFIEKKNKQCSILDVGCGNGNIMLLLQKMGFKNIQGVEYEEAMFKKALHDYPGLKITQEDAQNLHGYATNSIDVIISNQVLEHLPDPEKAIQEAKRVLKRNGQLVIGTPNGYHLNDILLRNIQLLYYGRCDHLQQFSKKKIYNGPSFLDRWIR